MSKSNRQEKNHTKSKKSKSRQTNFRRMMQFLRRSYFGILFLSVSLSLFDNNGRKMEGILMEGKGKAEFMRAVFAMTSKPANKKWV